MNIDRFFRNCELELNQLKIYEPDPFYVEYFLKKFLHNVNQIREKIFEEADQNFGLFCREKISQQVFYRKAIEKNDLKAIDFSNWFSNKIENEHIQVFSKFIHHLSQIEKNEKQFPEIKIMLRAKERYQKDINLPISITLNEKKIVSKNQLKIEINRQTPLFLELINQKRRKNQEPLIRQNQITASSFIDFDGEIEVAYAVETYIPVIKRIYDESIEKIKELTKWE